MATTKQPPGLTIRVEDEPLSRAISWIVAERNRSVPDIVAEALRQWLDRQEEQEDLAAIAEAEGNTTFRWDEVKAEMREARTVRSTRRAG